ncbi:Ubiquinol-cytochrome c reductase complex 6.7 kDa [Musa troglodytarum]|uniref:Ubiquinol-cytochrome c reductase complex 6.7 kDa n=1 Tax=Musa troglodytarum TaxID=320322 RepID=A0A9E7H416_9LILI|nr:Ubiquinol-cytochrome c reductase complex 6.7 kDa [Musa troglodytarum]
MATGSGLFTFLRPRLRPQSTDIAAAATWGVAAATGALWFVQDTIGKYLIGNVVLLLSVSNLNHDIPK